MDGARREKREEKREKKEERRGTSTGEKYPLSWPLASERTEFGTLQPKKVRSTEKKLTLHGLLAFETRNRLRYIKGYISSQ